MDESERSYCLVTTLEPGRRGRNRGANESSWREIHSLPSTRRSLGVQFCSQRHPIEWSARSGVELWQRSPMNETGCLVGVYAWLELRAGSGGVLRTHLAYPGSANFAAQVDRDTAFCASLRTVNRALSASPGLDETAHSA
jgi:hypothetical protein